ncbi:sulfite exporter TauE/SafE family protein [Nonomuraea turkmeniaca]|uniref:Probable membrane transporter protein n=1 Tax=Nonomuraea turkmeniaca TaxID=103838 RepID=A0A5S4FGZ4_9ACTN|nr:TSUP family transporter [Nonomuraea turkmeniaca]TMR19101.1 sulfite exporter TauE/SafE family protein [Nonomuraea turkmeniaca]
MPLEQVLVLLVAAAGAGWVDAVVGGGGLLQLPAIMITGMPTVEAMATNKLSSVFGTTSAAVAYARSTKVDRQVAIPGAGMAVLSAGLGAWAAAAISAEVLRPAVMVVLLAVAAFVTLRPSFGSVPQPHLRTGARVVAAVAVAGVGIAFYDGIMGPGTGTFLIIAFTTILGLDFVSASASAKIINIGTNVGALVVFGLQGHVQWALGLGMAVCNVAGAQVGARMALKRGTAFVRIVLLCVVAAMVVRLGWQQFA